MAISRGMRLTWTKTKEKGVFRSAHNLKSQTTGAIYKVIKDENDMTFRIINLRSQVTVKTGGDGINNKAVLQRNIKLALRKLGVQFKTEWRNYEQTD